MKAKNLKKSFLLSVLSLVLCVSMFIGTTFAWFTDSITNTKNKIMAGNLDIELYFQVEGQTDWTKVDENTNIFKKDALWEPGHTEVVKLKVVNEGSLALKYQLGVNIAEEIGSVNQLGDPFKLSDYIKYGVIDGKQDFADRDKAVEEAAKVAKSISSYAYTTIGALKAAEESIVTMVVYMPTTVGNEANAAKGEAVPTIFLGLNLYATQTANEFDSFGNDYDEGAWMEPMFVYTAAELATALTEGIGEENAKVILANDIVLTEEWTPIGDKDAGEYFMGTFDGNGHTISGLNVGANDYDALISAAKDATIKNLTVEGTVKGVNAAGIVARVEGNTVIENCVSNVAVSGTTKAGGIVSNVTGADAKIVNCVNNADVSCSNAKAGGVGGIIGYVNTNAYVEVIGCTNNGAVTGTDNQTTGAVIGYAAANSSGAIVGFKNTGVITGKNYVGDGNGRWLEAEDGTVLAGYCGTPANWILPAAIATADELVNAFATLKAKDILYITNDIDMTGKTIAPVTGNKAFSMYGNGHTISNLKSSAQGLFVDKTGSAAYTFNGVVLEDCSVNSTTNYGALFVGYGDTSDAITITDCHVKNCTVVSAKYAAAFVGYTAGWNVQNDGPVYSDVTVQDCSMIGGSITGGGSTAVAIAHAGGNPDTTCIVENLKVDGVAINGEDAAHTGIAVGTANVGDTVINNVSYANVTGNYNTQTVLYGRFVPDTTGTLVIDGATVDPAELTKIVNEGGLSTVIAADKNARIYVPAGNYETNLKIEGGSDVLIVGSGKDTVLNGQIATTSSTEGTITLRNLTINVDSAIQDSTGISQTGKSAIAIWGNQTVICENVTFNMSLSNSTAITSWWDTGIGTTIIVRNCTFNCNGQRPIRATGNVTVENCVFNDPYRYAVQLTAKASTATELDKAVVNFNNNVINNGASGKAFVYGVQLEGADYGCNDLVINGAGNTINAGEWDTANESAMYYCECGKVNHETVVFNTEVTPVHEG